MNAIRLIIFGAPGAGKGTQAKLLAQDCALFHLSTGDVLRAAIAEGTELGTKAKDFIDRGALVPDDLVNDIVVSALEKLPKAQGFILDGYPRTLGQAAALDKYLELAGRGITGVISLEVDEEELIHRILDRAKQAQNKRSDDDETVIRSRFKAFENQTMPLKRYYEEKGLLCEVSGIGEISSIADSVKRAAIKQVNC